DLGCRLRREVAVVVDEVHGRPGRPEVGRDGEADTACGTGDDDAAAGEVEGQVAHEKPFVNECGAWPSLRRTQLPGRSSRPRRSGRRGAGCGAGAGHAEGCPKAIWRPRAHRACRGRADARSMSGWTAQEADRLTTSRGRYPATSGRA